MNYSTYRFTLNMHTHLSQAYIKVFKGDTAVKLIMTLSDGGSIYKIVCGCKATLTGTKPNGEKLKHSCRIEGDTIIYIFDNETADQAGLATCEITLYDENGMVITAPKITIDVAEKEVEGSEPISEYSSAAIATVMGAAAGEYARQNAELTRQANEEQRQIAYKNALIMANEAKTISQEAYSKAKGSVTNVEELVNSNGITYLHITKANGDTVDVMLDDTARLTDWNYLIDTTEKFEGISNMHGNVLITCEPPSSGYALNVPERVKYLKIDARLSNANSFSSISHDSGSSGYDSECIFDGSMCDFGDGCSIASFKEVRNVITKGGEIADCGYVFNCTAQTVSSCAYVDFLTLKSSDDSAAQISQCPHVCHVSNYCPELYIDSCEIVEEIVGSSSDQSLTISNANSVNLVRGFGSVAYEKSCVYVNPHTCQGYVSQQDAIGKVQVLTADGSFDAIDINGIVDSINGIVDSINGIEEELTMINEGGIE